MEDPALNPEARRGRSRNAGAGAGHGPATGGPQGQSYRLNITQPDSKIQNDLSSIVKPMDGMLKRFGSEQRNLHEKYQGLLKENKQLEQRNQKLEQEVLALQASIQNAVPHPASQGSAVARRDKGQGRSRDAGIESRDAGIESRDAGIEESNEEFLLQFDAPRQVKLHSMQVHSVAMMRNHAQTFDDSSLVFASASWDQTVKFYDITTDTEVRTYSGNGMQGLYSVAFSKTKPNIFGCSSCDKKVYLWDWVSETCVGTLSGHNDEVNAIDFHDQQQVMVTASDDATAKIWDFSAQQNLRTLAGHQKAVYDGCFLGPDSQANFQYLCATVSFDYETRVWDIRDKRVVAKHTQHTDDIIGVAYSPVLHLLATGSDDGRVGLWDTRTWKVQQQIKTREAISDDNEVKRVAWSPDGKYLAAGCSSGSVLVYYVDCNPARLVATLPGHADCVFDVTWGKLPQSNKLVLVSGSHDCESRIWIEADASQRLRNQ